MKATLKIDRDLLSPALKGMYARIQNRRPVMDAYALAFAARGAWIETHGNFIKNLPS